jgi:phosphoribosylformylglycinamidine synthase II
VSVTQDALDAVALTNNEYEQLQARLGRIPNDVELGVFGSLWSEHCGYKHSKLLLRLLPSEGEHVLTRVGEENAGAIDIGDGWAIVMKVESHNHPSAIEPYQGAATGVGGIVRDIFAMGAYPIAILDSLRFGLLEADGTRYLLDGVVAGIGGYGNCLGIPTIGGEIAFGKSYQGNPLVNAMCIGLVKSDSLIGATAKGAGNALLLVGAETGRDGIHGASGLASRTDPEERFEEMRPAVQVGNPFMEKKLMEACYELVSEHRDWLIGLQDLGAAGLTSSVIECCGKGQSGAILNLEKVPCREEGMSAYEIMLSESQERMLAIVKREHVTDVMELFQKWELVSAEIGEVTDGDNVILRKNGKEVGNIPVSIALEPPQYRIFGKRGFETRKRAQINPGAFPDLNPRNATELLLKLLQRPNLASKQGIYRQYDHQVLTNTVVGPGGDAAVLRIPGTKQGIAVTTDCNGHYCELDPYTGGAIAVAEAARNIVCTGAIPVAVTDCLNFGSPENPEVAFALEESIRGIAAACELFETPVVSGNVSLYNETGGNPIEPTPVIGMLGVLEDVTDYLQAGFNQVDADVWLVGQSLEQNASTLSGSEYLSLQYEDSPGTPQINLDNELILQKFILDVHQKKMLLSAHDCAEGGLAIALAECALIGNYGFQGDFPNVNRLDATLFGEAQTRIIVSTSPKVRHALEKSAVAYDIPLTHIGTTQDEKTGFNWGPIATSLSNLKEAWTGITW